jgi:hypothetical protein
MLPKRIRDMQQDANKSLQGMKRVLKLMQNSLTSNSADKICVASAFFQILKHHMENGDLRPENISLATMLRGDSPGVKE